MRKQGAYIVTFEDGSKGVYYYGNGVWRFFGIKSKMSDEELDFKSIEWIKGQE